MRSRSFAVLASLLLAPSVASAQIPAESGIPNPGRSLATNDDASTVSQNPANLGFLPAPELRWLWYKTRDVSPSPIRGHQIELATPLFLGFSTGLRLDLVNPTPTSLVSDYRWLTWGLAFKSSDAFSLGLSIQRSYSGDPGLDGMLGTSAAFSWRPASYLGFAAVARNWNGYSRRGIRLDRGYDLGLSFRPLGRRTFEVSLEASKTESLDEWTPRAAVGLDVPYIGRLRGDLAIQSPFDTPAWVATVGVDLNAAYSQASGGAIFGNALNSPEDNGAGYYVGLAVRGYREPGLLEPVQWAKLRIESTPGVRGHVHLLRSLWKMAESNEVGGVLLQLKTEPADSMAHAEELGDAIRMLRSRGKKVVCHLEDAGSRSLYVCAQADRVVINPAGGLRFAGLRAQYMYFGELASKLGVRTDFVRIGAHKTAPEQYTERGPLPTADADHLDLLQQYEQVFVHDVGGGRQIAMPELRARIAKGPFLAKEAREAGLVDSYAFDDELDQVAGEVAGKPVRLVDANKMAAFAKAAPSIMGERDRVAIVYVEGDMIDGRSRKIPILGTTLAGSYTIADSLKQAREDPRVKAIVVRVESPGGSSMAADVIWREIEITKKVKPVVVSMGTMAASGGYYLAAPATTIWANRTTVTGSIGIFYGKADVEQLLQKIGVNVVTYRTAPRADAESLYRPFTDDERKELGRKVKQFYDTFVDRVARGRDMTPDAVDAVARGRVWTGQQALERKLVDHLGGLREAIEDAEKRANLPHDAMIVELPAVPTSLLQTVLSLAGFHADAEGGEASAASEGAGSIPIPHDFLRLAGAMLPFFVFSADQPLARMEVVPDLP